MIIRAARSEDTAQICALWNAVITDSTATFTTVEKTPQTIDAMIADRGEGFIVACKDQNVLGFATFGPFRTGPGYADVVEHSVYVYPAFQGAGVGTALLVRLESNARRKGKRIMVAAIAGDNTEAITFHGKSGFTPVALMPDIGSKFGALHDLWLMQKNL